MRRLTIILLLSLPAFAQDISLPHNLSNNTVADADAVMDNFNALKTGINNSLQTYSLFSNVVVGNGLRSITPGVPYPYSGKYNSATGFYALYNNTSGSTNTASGYAALGANTSGRENTAMGYYALNGNEVGGNNAAFGLEALMRNKGWDNTAVGRFALHSNVFGSSNTAVGSGADVSAESWSNATAIGFGAIVDATNKIQLGNTSVESVSTSGKLTTGAVTYPNTHGTNGQVLGTSGSGELVWFNSSQIVASHTQELEEQVASLQDQLQSQQEELLAIVQSQQEQMLLQQEQIAQLQQMIEHQFAAR